MYKIYSKFLITNYKNIQKNLYQKYKMDSEKDVLALMQHFALITDWKKEII
jgi:hypothetical protein